MIASHREYRIGIAGSIGIWAPDDARGNVAVAPIDGGRIIAERFSSAGVGECSDSLRAGTLSFDGIDDKVSGGNDGRVGNCSCIRHGSVGRATSW